MTEARRLYRRTLALALLGLLAIVVPFLIAMRAVDLRSASPGALLEACRRMVSERFDLASVPVLALTLLAIGVLLLAVRSTLRQLRGHRRFMQTLVLTEPGPGAIPDAIVIQDPRAMAFCAGFLRPRVLISTGALGRLSAAEVEAVLVHERHHRSRRDPLRLLLLRTLADAFFFLPALHSLRTRYSALAEVAADEAALRVGGRRTLASALLAFGQGPNPGVVGIAPERVQHLLGRGREWRLPAPVVAASLLAPTGVVALAIGTASAAGDSTVGLAPLLMDGCRAAVIVVPFVAIAGLVLRRAPLRVLPGS